MTDEPNTQIVGKQQQHITQSTENKNNNGPHLLSHSRWISCCINMTAHTVLIVYDINAFAACFPLNSIRECCLIARIQTTNTFHRTLYHLSASYNLSTFYISCNTNFPFRSHFFSSALHIWYVVMGTGTEPQPSTHENPEGFRNEICGRGVHYENGNFAFKPINWLDFLSSLHFLPISCYSIRDAHDFPFSDSNQSRQFAAMLSTRIHQLTTKLCKIACVFRIDDIDSIAMLLVCSINLS